MWYYFSVLDTNSSEWAEALSTISVYNANCREKPLVFIKSDWYLYSVIHANLQMREKRRKGTTQAWVYGAFSGSFE